MSSYSVEGAGDTSYNGTYTLVGNDFYGNPYYTMGSGGGQRWLGEDPRVPSWNLTAEDDSGTGDWNMALAYSNYPATSPTSGTWVALGPPPAPTVTEAGGHTITSTVTDGSGHGVAGVTVSAGGYSGVTGADGTAYLNLVPDGTYTITAAGGAGLTITPSSHTGVVVSGADVGGGNFTATSAGGGGYGSISGVVTKMGAPAVGVTVTAGAGTTLTAEDGSYAFVGLPVGAYTVTAADGANRFEPASVPVVLS